MSNEDATIYKPSLESQIKFAILLIFEDISNYEAYIKTYFEKLNEPFVPKIITHNDDYAYYMDRAEKYKKKYKEDMPDRGDSLVLRQLTIYGLSIDMILDILNDKLELKCKYHDVFYKKSIPNTEQFQSMLNSLIKRGAIRLIDKKAYVESKVKEANEKNTRHKDKDAVQYRDFSESVCNEIRKMNFYEKGDKYQEILKDVVEKLCDRLGLILSENSRYNTNTKPKQILRKKYIIEASKLYSDLGIE